MKRRCAWSLITTMLLAATCVSADDTAPDLRLEYLAVWSSSMYFFEGVYLVNYGEQEVTVVTDGSALVNRDDEENRHMERTFQWSFPMHCYCLKKIIPSEASLHRVTLQKGEMAALRGEALKECLEDLPKVGDFVLNYKISELIGKRFNAWHEWLKTIRGREF